MTRPSHKATEGNAMNIVIIIPTYNEKDNIKPLIEILEEKVLPQIKNHTIRILVADDNSPDGTGEIIKERMKKWKNIELITGEKKGLGAAYARGMHYAIDTMKADAVMEFDADFQHDPMDIPKLIKAMDEGADYVIGSRYVAGGAIPKEWGLHRKIISRFGGLFAQVVLWRFNVHDMTSGYKLTKTPFLRNVDLDHLYSKYYAYKLHILHDVLRQGAKVKEVPIIFYERKEGSSKITRKDLLDSFLVVIRLRYRDSARFIKFLVVGGTGFVVQIAMQEFSFLSGLAYLLTSISQSVIHIANSEAFANGIAAAIGAESAIISNFVFNNIWTFKDRSRNSFQQTLIRGFKFNLTSIASVIIQFLAIWFGVLFLGDSLSFFSISLPTRDVILVPTIIFLVIPLNYFIYNTFIWRKNTNDEKVSKQ